MDIITLQMIYCVLCTLIVPLKSQTTDDKYIITSGRYPNDIYMYKGDVTSLSKSSVTPFKLQSESLVSNIDLDATNSTIFLLDLDHTCVFSISRFTSSSASISTMQCGISSSLGSAIAYDWVTSNMYWSDGIFQWIALRPMYTTDRQLYRVIIQEVSDISALAVDPINRYIFWFDSSPSGGRIERASLAGQQRKAIVTNGLLLVYDIVADVTSKRIFWVDYLRYSIESTNYEGFQRQPLAKKLSYGFYALAVDEEYLCSTLPEYRAWMCVHKISGDYKYIKEPRVPYGIAIFNKAIQPQDKSNYCESAACQHFCVNGDDRGICMCKEGYTLNQDGKICSATHGLFGKGILVSYKEQICILDYRSITHGIAFDFNCIRTGLQGVEYLEVNAAEHVIFYYDSTNKRIKSYDVRSGISKTIQTSTGIVSGLSFDWNQQKLYWCESDTGIIGRVSVRNYITEIFHDSEKGVNDVSVDPHNRTVFWIEGKTRIFSRKMEDGTKNGNILAEGGTKSCLFFDIKSSRLFWVQESVIVSIKEDGSDIEHHKSASASNQLIIFKSYFIWISGKRTIGTLPTTSAHSIKTTIILPDNGTITGIAVFDETSQPKEKGVCDASNGGCDQICIVVIDGRVCRCQLGFTLDSDGKTCITVPLNRDFLLATDLTHSRIYQVALKNGSIRTLNLPFVERPTAVRYDSASKYLYWTEANGKIKRAAKDGKDFSVIYSSVFGTYPERIELDQSSGYLYFITSDSQSSNKGYIGVIDTHNLYSKALLTGLRLSFGFAVYPSKGILFFTNNDVSISHIYRSPIDGSFKDIIYTTRTTHLYDLTIDYNDDRLYWSEDNQLWSGDLSGMSREKLATTKFEIFCFVLAYPYIYYHGDKHSKIIKLDITKKQPVTWMTDIPEIGFLVSLDIYPKAAPPANSLCGKKNGMCSTFCLPKEKSLTCGCKDGVLLLNDGKTCFGVTKCSDLVQFGSLEDTCQRFSRQACGFSCNSGYIAKVQPQTVICQENGTWNRDLSDICSETKLTDTPTTNTAVIAGGIGGSVVAIAIVVVGIVTLFQRKKSTSAERDVGQAHVYYLSQTGSLPRIRHQSVPSYSECSKKQLPSKRQAIGNSYSPVPGNAQSINMQENIYEEIHAVALESHTYYPQNPASSKDAENTYLELVNPGDYTSYMVSHLHRNDYKEESKL